LPEVAGDAGLLINPNEPAEIAQAMARVLLEPGLRTRMRASGFAQAARFTWEKAARETLAVYHEVLAA
jgi:glycosyltransferase involved in cell wall biosynthesis